MDSGQNPTSPMPGNGPAPAVPPTVPPTVPPVAPAPQPQPAQPITPPPFTTQPQPAQPVAAQSVMNSRRTRSARPTSANNMVAVPPQPATGDIILSPAPAPKKGINKGLIIGIIAAAVLVVGGIVTLLLLPKNGGSATASNYQEAFNIFANYLIYGEESNKNFADGEYKEYHYGSMYHMHDLQENEIPNYLNTAKQKYQNFLKFYQASIGDNQPDETIMSYYSTLDLLSYSMQYPIMNNRKILETYIENPNGAYELISDYYAPILESEDTAISDYAEQLVERTNDLLRIYSEYNEDGCIIKEDAIINPACLSVSPPYNNTEMQNLNGQYSDARLALLKTTSTAEDAKINSYRDVWEIEGIVYGE